jgi:photosynthetic reaction center cytochrome c subunit
MSKTGRIFVPVFAGLVLLAGGIFVSRAERPPVETKQIGYRGTSAFDVQNARTKDALLEANRIPYSVPYSGGVGQKAGTYYQNVKVLGDVDAGEFTRLMVNMTTWVSAEQGCAGCHNVENFADDGLYTKVVARRMLEMVRHINSDWTVHVAQTGVTCYTCHRGKLVPENIWFNEQGANKPGTVARIPAAQKHASAAAAGSALAIDPFTPFLEQANDIRIQATTALPENDGNAISQSRLTYALMLSMTKALGVNCNYCHLTRAFAAWDGGPPQRVTAWHGIRMVRDLNNNYLNPLKSVFPEERLGAEQGDAPKVNCATCHNGAYKPLFGVSMLRDFPELKGPPTAASLQLGRN